jgi:hypothetical protein
MHFYLRLIDPRMACSELSQESPAYQTHGGIPQLNNEGMTSK